MPLIARPFELLSFKGSDLMLARREVGKKQGEIARRLKISQSTYCKLENADNVFIIPNASFNRRYRIIDPDDFELLKEVLE